MTASTSVLFGAGSHSVLVEPISIVVVDDHESVQMVVREILISRGYSVLLCRDGFEALQTIGTHVGRLDLLLTEIVLPGMDGCRLSERARAIRGGLTTLYMSGYSSTCLERFGMGAAAPFLPKPFTPDELIGQVQRTLPIASLHADVRPVSTSLADACFATASQHGQRMING